jgi:hypothetical protein
MILTMVVSPRIYAIYCALEKGKTSLPFTDARQFSVKSPSPIQGSSVNMPRF